MRMRRRGRGKTRRGWSGSQAEEVSLIVTTE